MKNIVISGGTDGIGKALALTYLIRGDNIIVIGRKRREGPSSKLPTKLTLARGFFSSKQT